ncbi:hypothetical protein BH11ACT5_BH11ACT5_09760 [soil metagenome]
MPRFPHLVLAVVLLGALSACGGGGGPAASSASPSATHTPTASATPHPTASATPTATAVAVDPSILFTISSTVTAADGGVAHIVQTVYRPVATPPAGTEGRLDTDCDGWRAKFPSPAYVRSTYVATTDGPWTGGRIGLSMNGWPVYTGDFSTFQAYCATVLAHIPGTVEAVTPVPAGGSSDAADGWATLFYGFGIPDDDSPTALSDCVITLGTDALASAIAATWPTKPQVYPGSTCDVNR